MASRCNPTTRDYSSANTKSAQGQFSAQSIPAKNCACVYINAACFKCAAPHLSGEHERECVKMSECCVQAAGNEAVCRPTSICLSVMSAVLSVRRAFIYLFIFFLYLDPRISECRPPPSIGCRSLDRPKNLGDLKSRS